MPVSADDIESLIISHFFTENRQYKQLFWILMLDLKYFCLQAAYLVGVSDPNSSAGQKGLVDPAQFARANQSIQMACQNLVDPACTQSQVQLRPTLSFCLTVFNFFFLTSFFFFCTFFVLFRKSFVWLNVLEVISHVSSVFRCFLPPPSWLNTRLPCATPADWPPPRLPTLWPRDSLSSQPKKWPTPRPTWSNLSRYAWKTGPFFINDFGMASFVLFKSLN